QDHRRALHQQRDEGERRLHLLPRLLGRAVADGHVRQLLGHEPVAPGAVAPLRRRDIPGRRPLSPASVAPSAARRYYLAAGGGVSWAAAPAASLPLAATTFTLVLGRGLAFTSPFSSRNAATQASGAFQLIASSLADQASM